MHLNKHVVESHEISCPFAKCNKKFCRRSSFASHLSREHPKLTFAVLDSRHKVNAAPESGTHPDRTAAVMCTDLGSPDTSDSENACAETENSRFLSKFHQKTATLLLKLANKITYSSKNGSVDCS
jgi:hypothetical protein